MIDWGESLVKELAARRCIIFFGAGASVPCQPTIGDPNRRPPDWKELLDALAARLPITSPNRTLAQGLITDKKFLDAAEVITSAINAADYADCMRQLLEIPRFQQSYMHECILQLDPKIVITTNFDSIYDRYCTSGSAVEGYNVIRYTDHHLVQQLRSPTRVVVKAHGCITNTDHLVLTRSQYFDARLKCSHFFRVLDALCLTHTILFLGYSLSDPDIQIALENANISAPSTNRHYFVTPGGTHEALRAASEKTHNLKFLEFPAGDYGSLDKSLAILVDRVLSYRADHPDV
jgi:hypothetical protein